MSDNAEIELTAAGSGKSEAEVAFELLSKLKGQGVWGERNIATILDMYAECLDAAKGLRAYEGQNRVDVAISTGAKAPAQPAAAQPKAQPAPMQAAPQSAPAPQPAAPQPAAPQPAMAQPVAAPQPAAPQPAIAQPVHAQQQAVQQAFKQG